MEGNDGLGEALNGLLSDPQTMQKLMETAKGLMGNIGEGQQQKTETAIPTAAGESRSENSSIFSRLGDENQIRLIAALRPYLSPKRQTAADRITKMSRLLKVADLGKLFMEQ